MNEDELNERNILEILRNQRDNDDVPVLKANLQSDYDDQLEEISKMIKDLNDKYNNQMQNLKAYKVSVPYDEESVEE